MGKIKQRRKRGVVLSFEGLEKLQKARLESEYEENFGDRYTYEKISEITNLDINTIKKVLNAKEGVDKRSLECFFLAFDLKLTSEDYAKPNPNKRQDWGEAVCLTDFYGRTEELDTLEQWLLKDRCRLITLLGMGGIGKTSLSIKLAQHTQDKFDCVVWRSLRDAPPLEEFIANIIEFLSEEQVTEADLPESIGGRITFLIDYLRSLRCLLVFDNLESLLCSNGKAGFCREGYQEYGELFRRIGETEHQSCLLITTREKPKQVAALEGETLPVRTLRLQGLLDNEGEKILQTKGLNGSESEVSKLVKHYDGNALALKVVATTIRDLFDGSIKEFLQEQTSIFGDIRHLLDQQFERLSELEQEIVYWLAINREPTTLSKLREDMVATVPRMNLMEGLESLSRRSLVEQNEACFTLQSVVMEYVTCCLIEKVCQEVNTKKLKLFRCYALIKATAKDYIRETQIRLILQPVVEGLFALFRSEKNVEEQLTKVLKMQQETSPREPGYTAGNILNLLCEMEVDLKGYDFSNLCVWQADLRNATLHEVNFSHSDLSKTLFAEAFGGIWSVAFSPDGEILASGDTKGEIILRRVSDGQPIRSFKEHKGWVVSLDFSPDGKTLASSSCDCTAKLWDVETGNCLHTLREHEHEVWSVAFSPDGETLATGCDDNKVRLWQISTGECLKVFRGHTNFVLSIVFNSNETELLSGSNDNTIRLWDIETGECKKIFQGHNDGVRSIDISFKEQILVSAGNDRTVRLWNIQTGECLKVLRGHSGVIMSATFCSQKNFLASASVDQTIRLWNIETEECIKIFQGHSSYVSAIAFCLQRGILASGSYDQTVKLWNLNTHQCFKTFQGYSNQALSVTFSPNGQMLASGDRDRKVRLWDVRSGKVLKTLQEHTDWVFSVAFSPQGNLLASGSGDKTIKIWNTSTGQVVKTLQGHQAVVQSIAFSCDNKILASGSEDRIIRLWNTSTGQVLKTLRGHQAEVWSIAFSFDGQILASGSFDGTAKLWNIKNAESIKTLEHKGWVFSIAFSPDNTTLATTCTDQTIKLWNIDTGECKRVIKDNAGHSKLVAFSPDGQIIASYSQDRNIKLWKVSNGKCLKILYGHKALISSIAFCSDNYTLVSGSEDETIKVWNTESGECIKTLKVKKPYEFMNVAKVTSMTETNIKSLKMLGAVNPSPNITA